MKNRVAPKWKLNQSFLILRSQLRPLLQLKEEKGLNVNCRDTRGNSALHLAAFRDRQQMAAFLMQAGVKNDIKNDNGGCMKSFIVNLFYS